MYARYAQYDHRPEPAYYRNGEVWHALLLLPEKVFCYLWTDKKTHEPYLLMVEGKHLDHPQLEAGSRSRMKIFRVDPRKDLPMITIDHILQQALNLYKSGVIKIKG